MRALRTFLNLPDCTTTDSLGAQVPTINTSGSDYVGWTVTGSLTGKLVITASFIYDDFGLH